MLLSTLYAKTIDEVWHRLIFELVEAGSKNHLIYEINKGSYEKQKRLEFDCITFNIEYPGANPRIPIINPQLGIPSPVDEKYAEEYAVNYIVAGKQLEKNEQYTYASRINNQVFKPNSEEFIRYSEGFKIKDNIIKGDYVIPIKEIIAMYKSIAPHYRTNQGCLEIGQPSDITLVDPPCCRLIDTKIKNGKLHFYLYFRSWDLWAGLPVNLYGFQMLKELMAQEIGVNDGEIVAFSKGLHLYDHFWDLAKILARKDPKTFKFMGE